jgi:transcriptional regulator with XRE-family HTH domain
MNAKLLRKIRYKLNLTQLEFGKKLGVTREHISQLERSIYPLSEEILFKLKLIVKENNINLEHL